MSTPFKMKGMNFKSSPMKQGIKGQPKSGGFRDWSKGEEPPSKTKLKEWYSSTESFSPLKPKSKNMSKHLSFDMEKGDMLYKGKAIKRGVAIGAVDTIAARLKKKRTMTDKTKMKPPYARPTGPRV